jgi:hypothetical protein
MKLLIGIGIFVCGGLGSWLGALVDGGNMFGGWSLLFGTIGSFLGIWAGYKAGQSWLS